MFLERIVDKSILRVGKLEEFRDSDFLFVGHRVLIGCEMMNGNR
jgi:hypothetical protein